MFKWSLKNTWRNKRPNRQTSPRCHHLQTFPDSWLWKVEELQHSSALNCFSAPLNVFETALTQQWLWLWWWWGLRWRGILHLLLPWLFIVLKTTQSFLYAWRFEGDCEVHSTFPQSDLVSASHTPSVLKRDVEWGGGGWGGTRGESGDVL